VVSVLKIEGSVVLGPVKGGSWVIILTNFCFGFPVESRSDW
jgi:hypothetical protein